MKELDLTKVHSILLFDKGDEEQNELEELKKFLRHLLRENKGVESTLLEPTGSLGKPFIGLAIDKLRHINYEIEKELLK